MCNFNCSVEEELKRLHKALGSKSYGEVAFNYDEDPGSGKLEEKEQGEPTEEELEGGDELFIAPPELDIPINMALVCILFDIQQCLPNLFVCGTFLVLENTMHTLNQN
jgi:hypothetical protein